MHERPGFNPKLRLLLGLTILAVFGAFLLVPAIPQDPAYHRFADGTSNFGVPNFWNVLSNLPFLWVGLAGIRDIFRGDVAIVPGMRSGYLAFFLGVALIGPGSMYYHLAPDNTTLLWDRLPMTIAFMALFACVIAEYQSVPAGRGLLWPLIGIGALSVFYWHVTEMHGHGDLRLYGLVQFLPLVLIPLIMLLLRPTFSNTGYLWALLGAYGVAKVAEFLDEPIFRVFFLSGHSVKHLFAALWVYWFLLGIRRRTRIRPGRAR